MRFVARRWDWEAPPFLLSVAAMVLPVAGVESGAAGKQRLQRLADFRGLRVTRVMVSI